MDLESRREIFRCLVTHPFYTSSGPETHVSIKKQLILFFDRLFTHHIGELTGTEVHFEKGALRIGGDHLLADQDGVQLAHNDLALAIEYKVMWELLTS